MVEVEDRLAELGDRPPRSAPSLDTLERRVRTRQQRRLGVVVAVGAVVIVVAGIALSRVGREGSELRTISSDPAVAEAQDLLERLARASEQQQPITDDANPVLYVDSQALSASQVVVAAAAGEPPMDLDPAALFGRPMQHELWVLPNGRVRSRTVPPTGEPIPLNERARQFGSYPAPRGGVAFGMVLEATRSFDRLPQDLDEMRETVRATVHATVGDEDLLEARVADTMLYGLRENHLNALARAAWLRAIATLDGLSLLADTVDRLGRPAVGVAITIEAREDRRRESLYFDPDTGQLLERRTTVLPSDSGLVASPTETSWETYVITAVRDAPPADVVS